MLKREPLPAKAKYSVQLNFDAQGKEVTRGISEVGRAESRPDVAQCLRTLPMGISVPAPGAALQVVVLVEFP
jgi:hypothetical protein